MTAATNRPIEIWLTPILSHPPLFLGAIGDGEQHLSSRSSQELISGAKRHGGDGDQLERCGGDRHGADGSDDRERSLHRPR